MALWYSSPFDDLRRVQRDMNSVFGRYFDYDSPAEARQSTGDQRTGGTAVATRDAGRADSFFWPSVDVKENENALTVHAELPGMKKEDININLDNNVLTISGQRSQEKVEDNERVHRVERSYGSFKRSFALPKNLKEDQIKASYNDGVLSVEIPKAAPRAKPEAKRIAVA
eukprot:TRINITY_DN826_c0_g2_i1.p1 TRINITY_DN826_c0_g2~~TRINITY_DN826_c0_g2_i1.p1  ORF type:complete len:199 (+),score=24.28 TRINITY_DN826_c0_g2_i1:89-598(+)